MYIFSLYLLIFKGVQFDKMEGDFIKLPVNFQPLITSFEPEAFVFGFLTAIDNSQLPFLLSRYISIFACDAQDGGAVMSFNNNYEDYYFWQCGKLSLAPVHIPNYAVYPGLMPKLAQAELDDGRYILGLWNEEFIKGTANYNVKYQTANYMLYGYDEQFFYSLGIRKGNLGSFAIPYSEFEEASFVKETGMNMFWGGTLADRELGFDIGNVKKELLEFAEGKRLNNDGCAFGYKSIEYLAEDIIRRGSLGKGCNTLVLKCVWEYARLMRMRVEYMVKEGLTVYEHAKLASQIERAASELLSNASGKINNSLIEGIMRVAGETRALALKLLDSLESVN